MPILCKVTRGFYIESIHVAYAVVVDADGKIVFNSGDPKYLTCIRSALKPFQAATAVQAGATADFTSKELALLCASHSGEEIHVKTAVGILKKLGYTINDYECGSHAPYHKASADYLIRQGQTPTPLHNNCSGKHAGMLALAKHLKVDPKGYALPDHPVQQLVLKQVERYSGLHDLPISVDGCSLPTPFLPLYSIAVIFQKLASGDYPELNLPYEAMTAHSYLIAGEKRFDTDFLKVLAGRAVTKVGGEAIRGVGIRRPDGEIWGIAVKVLDGNQRANPVATLAVLEHLNMLTNEEQEQLSNYQVTKLFNHRKIHIGNISASIEE